MISEILGYIQPANLTPMLYAENLYAKSCKVVELYDEATLNKIFI